MNATYTRPAPKPHKPRPRRKPMVRGNRKSTIQEIAALFRMVALFGDKLTAYQLEYAERHPQGDETRFQAAARLVATDGVASCGNGVFTVRSDEGARAEYNVYAIPGELFCPCPDGTHSKHNKSGLCKHVISALMVSAIQEA